MKKIELDGFDFTISELLYSGSNPNYKFIKRTFNSGVILGVSLTAFATYQSLTNHNMTIQQMNILEDFYLAFPSIAITSFFGSIIFKKLYNKYSENKTDYVFEMLQEELNTKFDLNGSFSFNYVTPKDTSDKSTMILLTNDDGEHAVIQEKLNEETGQVESYIYDIGEVEIVDDKPLVRKKK